MASPVHSDSVQSFSDGVAATILLRETAARVVTRVADGERLEELTSWTGYNERRTVCHLSFDGSLHHFYSNVWPHVEQNLRELGLSPFQVLQCQLTVSALASNSANKGGEVQLTQPVDEVGADDALRVLVVLVAVGANHVSASIAIRAILLEHHLGWKTVIPFFPDREDVLTLLESVAVYEAHRLLFRQVACHASPAIQRSRHWLPLPVHFNQETRERYTGAPHTTHTLPDTHTHSHSEAQSEKPTKEAEVTEGTFSVEDTLVR